MHLTELIFIHLIHIISQTPITAEECIMIYCATRMQ